MGVVDGVPVVTRLHGTIGTNAQGQQYQDDGQIVDFYFPRHPLSGHVTRLVFQRTSIRSASA